jgi:predicted GH43/DUF377 family glycosyl hydrolase
MLEKIITTKLQPIFELKKKKTKDSSMMETSHNYSGIFEDFKAEMSAIFHKELSKRQSGAFGTRDNTILVKTMYNILFNAGIIQNEEDKCLFLQIVEKFYDPDESLSALNETVNNTSSDRGNKRKEKEVQMLKSKRMSFLVENELIYEEFEEILRSFLLKKKEHHIKSEADVLKYVRKNIEEIKANCFKNRSQEARLWPESKKDLKLRKLLEEKEEKKQIAERKKAEEAQLKKEEWERVLMKAEDNNIKEEKELEELAEPDGSQEGGNESEASYF